MAASAALALVLCASPAAAGGIYFYQGPDGSLHFSDKKQDRRWQLINPGESSSDSTGGAASRESELDHAEVSRHIERIGAKYHIAPDLIRAMIKVESDFNHLAMSRKGAMGLMQIMPETAKVMGLKDPWNPYANVEAGTKYLRYLVQRFRGSLRNALAAYNAGPSAVESHGGVPPYRETTEYVRRVTRYYKAYSSQTRAAAGTPGQGLGRVALGGANKAS